MSNMASLGNNGFMNKQAYQQWIMNKQANIHKHPDIDINLHVSPLMRLIS